MPPCIRATHFAHFRQFSVYKLINYFQKSANVNEFMQSTKFLREFVSVLREIDSGFYELSYITSTKFTNFNKFGKPNATNSRTACRCGQLTTEL